MWALKTLHEKNWRKSLHVLEFRHSPNFLRIIAATPGFQNTTGLPVLSVALFYWFVGVLLAWSTSGLPDLSSTAVDTVTGEMSLSIRSSRSRVLVSLTVSDEDELEDDVEQ